MVGLRLSARSRARRPRAAVAPTTRHARARGRWRQHDVRRAAPAQQRAHRLGLPQSLVPMQPSLGKPFHRPGWIYEEKYDGWRMLAFKDGRRVRLVSRQAVDHTDRLRELAEAIAKLKAPTLILDGEVCVFDKGIISQFHLLDRDETDE